MKLTDLINRKIVAFDRKKEDLYRIIISLDNGDKIIIDETITFDANGDFFETEDID